MKENEIKFHVINPLNEHAVEVSPDTILISFMGGDGEVKTIQGNELLSRLIGQEKECNANDDAIEFAMLLARLEIAVEKVEGIACQKERKDCECRYRVAKPKDFISDILLNGIIY